MLSDPRHIAHEATYVHLLTQYQYLSILLDDVAFEHAIIRLLKALTITLADPHLPPELQLTYRHLLLLTYAQLRRRTLPSRPFF